MLSYGHATAVEAKPQLAYVVDNVNSTVNVIDLDTCKVVASIPHIADPTGLAISPDNRRLYVTNGDGNSTTVIDTSTDQPIAVIPVGYMPTSVALSPDGKTAYVTNLWSYTVSVIDTADNKVTGTLEAGKNPSDVSVNPKTGDVYVSNHLDGTVSVYRNNSLVTNIKVGQEAGESAVTPDGSRLYVVSANDYYVSIIDTTTDQIIDKYTIGTDAFPMDVEISPDGNYAYIMTYNGLPGGRHGVDVVGTSDNRLLRDYSFDYPAAIAVSPDGQTIVIVSLWKDGIGIIRSSDGGMKAQLSNTGIKVVTSYAVTSAMPSNQASTPTPGPMKAAGQPPQAGTALEPLSVAWKNTYGVTGQDEAYAVIPVDDGYVLAGYANKDMYLVKTDRDGNKVWARTYGGTGYRKATSVVASGDSYIVTGFLGEKVYDGPYSAFLMKIDRNGNVIWEKTYRAKVNNNPVDTDGSAVIAVDDGYVVTGMAYTNNNFTTDVYLMKTDTEGNLVWERTYGDIQTNRGNSIVKANDGYVIAGYDQVFHDSGHGYDVTSGDILLMKTDFQGNLLWNRSLGGLYQEDEYSLIAVDDGYVIAGDTDTFSNGSMDNFDVYLVKTDLDGNMVWSNHYGGPGHEQGRAVIPVQNGYVVAGYTGSYGGRIASIYLMKADLNGSMVWNKTYVAPDMDEPNAMALADDGYVIAGFSCTSGIYTSDTYLLKVVPETALTPTPGPTMAAIHTPPTVPPQTPTETPSTAPAGLTSTEMILICGIIVLLLAIITIAAVLTYFIIKK